MTINTKKRSFTQNELLFDPLFMWGRNLLLCERGMQEKFIVMREMWEKRFNAGENFQMQNAKWRDFCMLMLVYNFIQRTNDITQYNIVIYKTQ